jgi:hypothetical protein
VHAVEVSCVQHRRSLASDRDIPGRTDHLRDFMRVLKFQHSQSYDCVCMPEQNFRRASMTRVLPESRGAQRKSIVPIGRLIGFMPARKFDRGHGLAPHRRVCGRLSRFQTFSRILSAADFSDRGQEKLFALIVSLGRHILWFPTSRCQLIVPPRSPVDPPPALMQRTIRYADVERVPFFHSPSRESLDEHAQAIYTSDRDLSFQNI